MLNKHFFKTVVLFTTFIAIGLFLVFTVGYFSEEGEEISVDSGIAK
jgi:hypothetical protein